MINVLLVERQLLFRDALKMLITENEDLDVIGIAGSGIEALKQVKKHHPDVVLMGFQISGKDGLQVTKEIKDIYSDTKVILLTDNPNEDNLIKALSFGANGILHREVRPDHLNNAIRSVHNDQTILSDYVTEVLRKDIYRLANKQKDILHEALEKEGIFLTLRELDVAELFQYGLSNRQIADRLSLSEGTVKNYVSGIYQALGIHKREKAVDYLSNIIKRINKNYL